MGAAFLLGLVGSCIGCVRTLLALSLSFSLFFAPCWPQCDKRFNEEDKLGEKIARHTPRGLLKTTRRASSSFQVQLIGGGKPKAQVPGPWLRLSVYDDSSAANNLMHHPQFYHYTRG